MVSLRIACEGEGRRRAVVMFRDGEGRQASVEASVGGDAAEVRVPTYAWPAFGWDVVKEIRVAVQFPAPGAEVVVERLALVRRERVGPDASGGPAGGIEVALDGSGLDRVRRAGPVAADVWWTTTDGRAIIAARNRPLDAGGRASVTTAPPADGAKLEVLGYFFRDGVLHVESVGPDTGGKRVNVRFRASGFGL